MRYLIILCLTIFSVASSNSMENKFIGLGKEGEFYYMILRTTLLSIVRPQAESTPPVPNTFYYDSGIPIDQQFNETRRRIEANMAANKDKSYHNLVNFLSQCGTTKKKTKTIEDKQE